MLCGAYYKNILMEFDMKFFSIALAGFLAWSITTNANATVIELNVADTQIEVGESFDVEVTALNTFVGIGGDSLLGFGFSVNVGSGLSFVGAQIPLPFIDASVPIFPDNFVSGIYAVPGPGSFVDQVLATLTFVANASGTTSISIDSEDVILGIDAEGLQFALSGVEAISQSTSVNVVSSPSVIALIVMAMVACATRRKLK